MSSKNTPRPNVKPSAPQSQPERRIVLNESTGSSKTGNLSRSNEGVKKVTARDATGSTGPKGPS